MQGSIRNDRSRGDVRAANQLNESEARDTFRRKSRRTNEPDPMVAIRSSIPR